MYDLAMDEIDDLKRELAAKERELIELRRLLSLLCTKCGRLSWDVPLEDYCQCQGIAASGPVGPSTHSCDRRNALEELTKQAQELDMGY